MPPSLAEIAAIEKAAPILIRVRLPDDTTKAIYIDSFTTVKAASKDVLEKIQLSDAMGWRLCENYVRFSQERVLDGSELLVEVICNWEKLEKPEKAFDEFEFTYRKVLWLEQPRLPNTNDSKLLNFTYHQAIYDLNYGFLLVEDTTMLQMVACAVYVLKMGSTAEGQAPNLHVTPDTISAFVPQHLHDNGLVGYVSGVKLALDQMAREFKTADDAKLRFLAMAIKEPMFGQQIFDVEQKAKPSQVWLGLGREGLTVYAPYQREPILKVPYGTIFAFASKPGVFSITHGNVIVPKKNFFIMSKFQSKAVQILYNLFSETGIQASALESKKSKRY